MQNDDFCADLDIIVRDIWAKIFKSLADIGVSIYSIDFVVPSSDELYEKYNIDKLITFSASFASTKDSIQYYYEGRKISPIHLYVTPDDYVKVGLLELLHETANQKTSKPDIRSLESKSYKESLTAPKEVNKNNRLFGMMASKYVKIEKYFLDDSNLSITVQAGEKGWTIIYADGGTEYKDVEDTPENNFNKAYMILKSHFSNITERCDVEEGDDCE